MRKWRVRNLMTHDVVTVSEDTSYQEIADVLSRHGISAVPVVDEFHRVVGVVSEADLLHKVEYAGEEHIRRFFESRRDRTARTRAHGTVARDLMTSPAITTVQDASLAAAARLMDRENVKRLPVVSDIGRIVGIISRSDILRVFQRSDRDILFDVRTEVLQRALWVDPDQVGVRVDNGVVTLTGQLDNRTLTQMAVRYTETVAGVVDVVDELTYAVDDLAVARGDSAPPAIIAS